MSSRIISRMFVSLAAVIPTFPLVLLMLFASSCYYSRSMSGEGYEGGHVYLVKELGEASPYSSCPAEQDPMEYLKKIDDTFYFSEVTRSREYYERLFADGYYVEDVYKFNHDKTENILTLSEGRKSVHYALYPGTLFRIKYFLWDFENGTIVYATVLNGFLAGKELLVDFGRGLWNHIARFEYPAGGTYPCWEESGRYRYEMMLDPDLVEDLGEISDDELKSKGLWMEPGSNEAMRAVMKPLPEGIDLKQLEQAALKNDVEAQIRLSKMYYEGTGVHKNEEKAIVLLEDGISQGNRDAEFRLALMDADNWGKRGWRFERAEEIFRKYADQGDVNAQFCLGLLLECGNERVKHSLSPDKEMLEKWKESVVWYQKAADQGDARAMRSLGMAYYEGERVEQDFRKAADWFRKAAELGDFAAQRNLGYLYIKGEGVEKDLTEAREWLEKAAAQGDSYAQELLADFFPDSEK